MILGIDNVGLATRDLDRSVAFYQKLGFSKAFQDERGCTLTAGSVKLFLFPAASQEVSTRAVTLEANPPGIDHISFLVDDVDRSYAEFSARGLSFLSGPADQSWGARTAVPNDPDGNNLYLLTWQSRNQSLTSDHRCGRARDWKDRSLQRWRVCDRHHPARSHHSTAGGG